MNKEFIPSFLIAISKNKAPISFAGMSKIIKFSIKQQLALSTKSRYSALLSNHTSSTIH